MLLWNWQNVRVRTFAVHLEKAGNINFDIRSQLDNVQILLRPTSSAFSFRGLRRSWAEWGSGKRQSRKNRDGQFAPAQIRRFMHSSSAFKSRVEHPPGVGPRPRDSHAKVMRSAYRQWCQRVGLLRASVWSESVPIQGISSQTTGD